MRGRFLVSEILLNDVTIIKKVNVVSRHYDRN